VKATAQEEIRPEPVGVVGPLTTLGERFVEAADGVRLFVQTFGVATENPAVVCIPGLTRTGRDFTGLATELAQDRLVLAVDLRGRGRSDYDPTKRSYRLEIYAHDVGRILDDFGVEKASLIGTSLGGLTAIWLGAAHPDRVAAIVLNDIGPEIQPEGAARIAAYAGRLAPVRSWDDAVVQTRLVSEDAAPGLSDDDWLAVARQRYREEPDGTVVLDHDPGVVGGPAEADDPWVVFEQLAGIPILVLRGSTSDVLAPSTVRAMEMRRPDLVSVEIPDRGHAPTLDESSARGAIRQFLAEGRQAPGRGRRSSSAI